MKYLIYLFLAPAIFGFALSCDSSKNDEITANLIPEEDYVQLMAEIQLLRTTRNSRVETADHDSLQKVIFEKYNVDAEQFAESNSYYQKQVKDQVRRVNQAIELLEAEMQKFETDSTAVENE